MKPWKSKRDWQLSRQALALVIRVRWRLWRVPFAQLQAQWRAEVQRELDAAIARGFAPAVSPARAEIEQVWNCSHAVKRAAWLVPQASCLTQAMALQMMLARRGQHCAVQLGVEQRMAPAATLDGAATKFQADPLARGSDIADGKFRAHAWVEWHGRVLIGGDVRNWKPLTVFAPTVPPAAAPF